MKINEAFPSKYLKSADIDDVMRVRIRGVNVENVGTKDKPEEKPVLQFDNGNSMVLNKTNANAIAFSLGGETDDWIGKTVELFVAPVEFNGKTVNAIRVRVPKQAKPVSQPARRVVEVAEELDPGHDPDDSIPF